MLCLCENLCVPLHIRATLCARQSVDTHTHIQVPLIEVTDVSKPEKGEASRKVQRTRSALLDGAGLSTKNLTVATKSTSKGKDVDFSSRGVANATSPAGTKNSDDWDEDFHCDRRTSLTDETGRTKFVFHMQTMQVPCVIS
jgi:hypothetical protein